jgi:outer membrane protein
MRGFVIPATLALALVAAPTFAQAPAAPAGQKPAPAPTAPAGQKPAAPAGQTPAAPPAAQTPAPPTPQVKPPAPFPQGAKVAYVNLQYVAQMSNEGKAAQARAAEFTKKKQAEIADRTKTLQANQQKLQTGGAVLNDQARAQLEKDIERQGRELERMQQDAQAELNELNQDLQAEFNKKLFPVLEKMSQEHQLHFLFSAVDAGLIWAAEGLDLSDEAVKRFDSATTTAKP